MLKKVTIAIIATLFVCETAYALDPMRIRIRTALPSDIETVGDAAQYYAKSIGYELKTDYPAEPESSRIANEEISTLSRTNSVLPVEEAILELLKIDYVLVIDKDHKLFSFEEGAKK
jgi:hypothetical protein